MVTKRWLHQIDRNETSQKNCTAITNFRVPRIFCHGILFG